MMTAAIEPIDDFAARARQWIEAELPSWHDERVEDVTLQRQIYDAGFGGLAFPEEYGGAGLTLEHQKAFYDIADALDRQVPGKYWVSIGMVAPTILERGSDEAKRRWLPTLLRGDVVCIQLLSEPGGGSDMAGATTRLIRDGDRYLLRGAKMWSTNAYIADFGLCLARSNWDVPKHRGLSLIMVPLQATTGVTVRRTRMANGTLGDVCEEFFDDVELPVDNLIGDEDDGWSVAQTLLFHERNQTAGIGFGYLGGTHRNTMGVTDRVATARRLVATAYRGGTPEVHAQELAGAYIDSLVGRLTSDRIMRGMALGTHQGPWGSLAKLLSSDAGLRTARAELSMLGADAVVWDGDDIELDNAGTAWLSARVATIGGGTSEVQRNIVSERLLGLPREPSLDRDLPFGEVLRKVTRT